jgi:hypothetical protein
MPSYFDSFLASGVSAILTKTTVAPLERIKILKQTQNYYSMGNYDSLLGSCRFIYKNEGFRGFYRGHYSNMIRVLPSYVIKFPANEFYKKLYKADETRPERLLLAGISAGSSQITFTYPLDIIRTRMTLDHHMTSNYNSYYKCARNILKNEGIWAFYKGYPVSGLTYPVYVGLQFFIYEYFKKYFSYFAGAIAGITAQTLMYPGDVVKRHLQINGIDDTGKKYNGLIDCIRKIYGKYGFRGFYTGYGVNLLKAAPETMIQFAVYDKVTSLLRTK